MSLGHLGAGLILKKAGKGGQGLNAGLLWLAALGLDFVYGFFVILGLEHMPPTSELARMNVLLPYSHGYLSSVGWAGLAFLITWLVTRKRRPDALVVAGIVAAAVLSHLLLDMIAYMIGLSFGAALAIEIGISLLGAGAYVWVNRGKSWVRRWGLVGLMGLYAASQSAAAGSASAASAAAADPRLLMAVSLASWALLVLVAYLLDREVGQGPMLRYQK